MYYSADLAEAEQIAARARELRIPTVRYLLTLQMFEEQPPVGHAKRTAYDTMIAALNEVVDRLKLMQPIERSAETSED